MHKKTVCIVEDILKSNVIIFFIYYSEQENHQIMYKNVTNKKRKSVELYNGSGTVRFSIICYDE